MERLSLGEAMLLMSTCKELWSNAHHWAAIARAHYGVEGATKETLHSLVLHGLERVLEGGGVKSTYNASYQCTLEALRVMPGLCVAVRINEMGDYSQGAIQDPRDSCLTDGEVSQQCFTSKLRDYTQLAAKGWLLYPMEALERLDKLGFCYGSGGYDTSPPFGLSWSHFGSDKQFLLKGRAASAAHHPVVKTLRNGIPLYVQSATQAFTLDNDDHLLPLLFGCKYTSDAGHPTIEVDAEFVRAHPDLLEFIFFN